MNKSVGHPGNNPKPSRNKKPVNTAPSRATTIRSGAKHVTKAPNSLNHNPGYVAPKGA